MDVSVIIGLIVSESLFLQLESGTLLSRDDFKDLGALVIL